MTGPRWNGVRLGLRGLGLLAVAGFLAFAFTPLPNWWHGRIALAPHMAPADAIVVLGAGVSDGGVLTHHSLRRAVEGVRLHRLGLAPKVLLLGPQRHAGPSEAVVRARLARDLGVDPQSLEVEARGTTTRHEAALAWEHLGPERRRILLVTGSYHMPRAKATFERAGFEVFPAPSYDLDPGADEPAGRIALGRGLIHELLARAYYRVSGYL